MALELFLFSSRFLLVVLRNIRELRTHLKNNRLSLYLSIWILERREYPRIDHNKEGGSLASVNGIGGPRPDKTKPIQRAIMCRLPSTPQPNINGLSVTNHSFRTHTRCFPSWLGPVGPDLQTLHLACNLQVRVYIILCTL